MTAPASSRVSADDREELPIYIMDTCSFTELQWTYPSSLLTFEGVWRTIETLAEQSRLFSIELVLDELSAVDNEISQWANHHSDLFLSLDEEIQQQARTILASYQKLVDLKKKKSTADPFLIAAAIVKEAVVVTEERPSGGPPALKIPDVCKALKVECIPLWEVLKRESSRI